jgi:hypothetical protein
MVGFGAGAYIIALADRGTPVTPSCGSFAVEPAVPGDAGADGSGFPMIDGAVPDGTTGSHDAGSDAQAGHDAGTGRDATAGGDAGRGTLPDASRDGDGGVSTSAGSSGGCAVSPSTSDRDVWSFIIPLLGMGLVFRRKRS